MKENQYDIKELQKYTNAILIYFANFCEQNHLRYFLAGGTLLGAVRHQGFIPWDDDIDIAMPRSDFERLISMKHEFDGRYILRYRRWDSDAFYSFLKVEDTFTTKVENSGSDRKYFGGLSIDIFPQDGLPEEKEKQKQIIKRYYQLIALRDYRIVFDPFSARFRMVALLNRAFFSFVSFDSIVKRYVEKYDYDKCKYVRSFCGLYGEKETYRRELFGDGTMLTFEGHSYPVPKYYHEYLTQMYGDYMQLPPEEKRVSGHINVIIDLHNSYRKAGG